jgi:hypothetical protein
MGRSAVIVSCIRPALWAKSRSCQPPTIAGLEAPSATSTKLPVSEATDETPSAIETGLLTPIAIGPTFIRRPGVRWPMAVASEKTS